MVVHTGKTSKLWNQAFNSHHQFTPDCDGDLGWKNVDAEKRGAWLDHWIKVQKKMQMCIKERNSLLRGRFGKKGDARLQPQTWV